MKPKQIYIITILALIFLLIYPKISLNKTHFTITPDTNVSQVKGLSQFVSQEEVNSFAFRYWNIDGNYTKNIPSLLISLRTLLKLKDTNKVLSYIKDNNLSVDVKIQYGTTPLMYSSFYNDENTSKELIKLGANPHAKDRYGLSALAYAIENNSTKTARLLVDNGVRFEDIGVKSRRSGYDRYYILDNVIQSYLARGPIYTDDDNKLIIDGDKIAIKYPKDVYVVDTHGSDGENFFEYIVNENFIELAKLVLESGYKPKLLKGDLDYTKDAFDKGVAIDENKFNYLFSVYSKLHIMSNYKPMLNLLLKYNVPGFPDKDLLKKEYEECHYKYVSSLSSDWFKRWRSKNQIEYYMPYYDYSLTFPVLQKYCYDKNGTFEIKEYFAYINEYTKAYEMNGHLSTHHAYFVDNTSKYTKYERIMFLDGNETRYEMQPYEDPKWLTEDMKNVKPKDWSWYEKNPEVIFLDKNQTRYKVKLYREVTFQEVEKAHKEYKKSSEERERERKRAERIRREKSKK